MSRAPATSRTERRVFQVSELTQLIRRTLEERFGSVWVEGEISNFRRQASGHCYFTLKDEQSQISAVLFRGNQRNVKVDMKDGLRVRAYGELSVYEPRGTYQVIVRQVEEVGKGSLQAQFEALKERLEKEGLFAAERKQPLPMLPRRIGIVTSPTGAAIRDILNVITRRFPNVHILLAPAKVQGEGAAEDVADGIERLNAYGGLDALIVGRGGGSLEDLWCFNEERVARAIAASELPVISAVGHEIDFTIADFVADLRAPTPSAAAELIVGQKDAFEQQLVHAGDTLTRSLQSRVLSARNRLLRLQGRPAFREPRMLVRQAMQQVDMLAVRMEQSLRGGARDARDGLRDYATRSRHALHGSVQHEGARLQELGQTMGHAMKLRRGEAGQALTRLEAQLRALSPLAVLERGYSMTLDAEGRVVTDAAGVGEGDLLRTRVSRGTIESEVRNVKEK